MKKLFFTLSILTASTMGLLAQGISGGLKAGVNFSNQKWSASGISASADARTGFHVGGYLNIGFSESFSVQPELLYNSVGAKFGDDAIKTDYISLPIMVQYNPIPLVNLHVGPQFGFLMSAKADDEDVKDAFKGLDLGVGFGAGLNLPMGLGVQARYVLGLSNISEESDEFFGDVEVKNTAFQISLTYKLFGGE
jgi:hypothetical protein